MRRNKHFFTVVSLVLGLMILTTAAVANFENANGYTAYKTALKGMLGVDNFTANLTMDFIFDGNTQYQSKHLYQFDKNGDVMEHNSNIETEGARNYNSENWVIKNPDPVDEESKYLSVNVSDHTWNISRSYGAGWMQEFDTDEMTQKAIRFTELLADTFVGDLKNNFVLTSDRDGIKQYQIVLSGNQMPELVTAGFSMLYAAQKADARGGFVAYADPEALVGEKYSEADTKAWEMLSEHEYEGVVVVLADGTLTYFETTDLYYSSEYYKPDMTSMDDLFRTMDTEPFIDSAKCFLSLDEEGRLVSNTIEGTLTAFDKAGAPHTLTLRVTVDLSDYGTTVIDAPVIPEEDTVYDYSVSSPDNQFSYTVTQNGVTTTYQSDKVAEEAAEKAGQEAADETADEGSENGAEG